MGHSSLDSLHLWSVLWSGVLHQGGGGRCVPGRIEGGNRDKEGQEEEGTRDRGKNEEGEMEGRGEERSFGGGRGSPNRVHSCRQY